MKKGMLSVVVPVYNVAQYLNQCLNSILAQSYRQQIEIIIIDDGSTDGSSKICDQYLNEESVTVVHQKNAGLAAARNRGIELANGEYIAIIDSDDWIDANMYADLIQIMQTTNSDIGVVGRRLTNEKGTPIGSAFCGAEVVSFKRDNAMQELLLERKFDSSACDKVFRKKLLVNAPFPNEALHDDVGAMFKIVHQANQVVHIGTPAYYYRQRTSGISKQRLTPKKMDLIHFSSEIAAFVEQHYPKLQREGAYFYYRNLKNFRAQLATEGATTVKTATEIIDKFNHNFWSAIVNRHFSWRDRLVLISNRIGIYQWLKNVT